MDDAMSRGNDIPERLDVRAADFPDVPFLTAFAAATNALREHAQTFCSTRTAAIEAELCESVGLGHAFVCLVDDRVVGLASAFLGHPAGNADVILFVDPAYGRYQDAAAALFARLRAALDPGIRFTFYFPKENERCARFLAAIGARRRVNEYQLAVQRGEWKPVEIDGVTPLERTDGPSFKRLYDAIFPDIYLSAEEILDDLEGRHRVFVAQDETGFVALGVLRLNGPGSTTAEVIGVRADRRGRGWGRTILAGLLREAFVNRGAERVDLIVDLDNESAIRLYTDQGFCVEREHACFIVEG